jgi:hypothetical protein
VYGSAVVATVEQPVATTKNLAAQIQLADVVVCGEPTIVEEAPQRDSLIRRVAKRSLSTKCRLAGAVDLAQRHTEFPLPYSIVLAELAVLVGLSAFGSRGLMVLDLKQL